MTYKEARLKLEKAGQLHVLKYYDELTDIEKDELMKQINKLDLNVIKHLNKNEEKTNEDIKPLAALEIQEINKNKQEYKDIGTKAIKDSKVAALILAGGLGTRLGSENPKGMYNIGITKEIFIFQRLFENTLEVVKEAGSYPHIILMTSEQTDKLTREFLKEKNYFGYKEDKIHFFVQDTNVVTDYNGKVYMENKYKIANSPNGNGGWLRSLRNAGLIDFLVSEGIEWINVVSVDNVLQRICDPVFIGATISKNVNVGAKVVRKVSIDEKVGVMCLRNNKPSIVEYYELTDELKNTKDTNGNPAYNFGVILNYLFKLEDLIKLESCEDIIHIVEKKINFMNDTGNLIKANNPNGYKFETLVLDLINKLESCLPYEVIRNFEFAPIKNKTGVDSVETAQKLLIQNNIEI